MHCQWRDVNDSVTLPVAVWRSQLLECIDDIVDSLCRVFQLSRLGTATTSNRVLLDKCTRHH